MMFVINPDPYLVPSYRVSPFRTIDITINNNLPKSLNIDSYFEKRFNGKNYQYTFNGRQAINIALKYYHLKKDDVVTILTSSGNFYISSCVTREIESFCNWSRQIERNTKLIFINHEFGYPFQNLNEVSKKGLPIIEDCAYSFFSSYEGKAIGNIGDFAIYSFPKMFPLQIGGLLTSKVMDTFPKTQILTEDETQYIKNVLSYHIQYKEEIIATRLRNYAIYLKEFKDLGLTNRFELKDGVVPGVFLFRINKDMNVLQKLKEYFFSHGVQSSIFYGENSFFIPIHQNLAPEDCRYIVAVLHSFLNKYNND